MAHYVAKTKSRFHFSHDHWHLPVDGLLKFVLQKHMQMKFRSIKGQQVPVHSCMNFIYRSEELEGMCAYEFYSQIQCMGVKRANDEGIEDFEFKKEHPLHGIETAVYREFECVPVFAWKWLGSTNAFQNSLLKPSESTDSDYYIKENYALRFMLLFLPFRSHADLQIDGSYIKAFQKAHKEDRFEPEMIKVANNIQNLLDSVDSGFPDHPLNGFTIPVTEEDPNSQEEEEEPDSLLFEIGEYLSRTEKRRNLNQDATSFYPKFVSDKFDQHESESEKNSKSDVVLKNVIEHVASPTKSDQSDSTFENCNRFCPKISQLNSLFLQDLERTTESTNNPSTSEKPKRIINANGTWESIIRWGINAELDLEQFTAFEILAATYVLSFYNEAEMDTQDLQTFRENKKHLEELAQYGMTNGDPLRMFVTGPAGAGKCKYSKLHVVF